MNIREAVNSPDFEILGLNAENFKRWLELRAVELSTDEYRGSKINTLKEAKKQVSDILYNNARAV